MSDKVPNLREMANNGVLQNLADIARELRLGDLLGFLIRAAANTQTGVVPTAGNTLVTFAAPIAEIYDLVSTAGTFTGRLTLKIGDANLLPLPGEAVWAGPGASTVRLNAADVITAVDAKYARVDATNVVTSDLNRSLGQRD